MTMRQGLRGLLLVALAALAGCSGGSDGTTPSNPPEPAATTAASDASNEAAPEGNTEEPTPTEPRLTLLDTAPAASSVSVPSASLTEDRIIRRGEQSEIRQGQTFIVDEATSLGSISFQVVAGAPVDASESIALNLYEVNDPTSSVPSGFVDLGAGDDPLVLPLGQPLVADIPTYLTFSFPEIELEPGSHYAALLSLGDGASATVLYMQHAESDVYPEGLAIRFEGSTWKADRVVGDQAFALTLTSR